MRIKGGKTPEKKLNLTPTKFSFYFEHKWNFTIFVVTVSHFHVETGKADQTEEPSLARL